MSTSLPQITVRVDSDTQALLLQAAAISGGVKKKAGCVLGGNKRGRLTSHPERKQFVTWIQEANVSGARLKQACKEAGISLRTYKRWYL